jgi:TfoX/Sxy family transcriptional regulator of competence genes
MASRQNTVDFILAQLAAVGDVSARKMFGEYGIYVSGKMPALVCDDLLFVKITNAGAALIDTPVQQAPYPGAKPHFLIDGTLWDDADWLCSVISATCDALPLPVRKKK